LDFFLFIRETNFKKCTVTLNYFIFVISGHQIGMYIYIICEYAKNIRYPLLKKIRVNFCVSPSLKFKFFKNPYYYTSRGTTIPSFKCIRVLWFLRNIEIQKFKFEWSFT